VRQSPYLQLEEFPDIFFTSSLTTEVLYRGPTQTIIVPNDECQDNDNTHLDSLNNDFFGPHDNSFVRNDETIEESWGDDFLGRNPDLRTKVTYNLRAQDKKSG